MAEQGMRPEEFNEIIIEGLLASPLPEDYKIMVRIVKQVRRVHAAVDDLLSKYATPMEGEETDNYTVRKQTLEYLGLVELGLRQYIETTELKNEN